MISAATKQIVQDWDTIQSHIPISPIRDEQQYNQAVEKLNELLDIVGDNEAHPLYDILDTLGTLIHDYEENHYPAPAVKGIDVLKSLMEEHQLSPSNLPEIGNEEIVSQVLAGKRELTVKNIRALSRRFGVSPATFID